MIKALHVTVETADWTAVVWLQYISRKLCTPQPEPPTVDAAGKEAAAKIMDISQSFGVSAQATSETLQTHGDSFNLKSSTILDGVRTPAGHGFATQHEKLTGEAGAAPFPP